MKPCWGWWGLGCSHLTPPLTVPPWHAAPAATACAAFGGNRVWCVRGRRRSRPVCVWQAWPCPRGWSGPTRWPSWAASTSPRRTCVRPAPQTQEHYCSSRCPQSPTPASSGTPPPPLLCPGSARTCTLQREHYQVSPGADTSRGGYKHSTHPPPSVTLWVWRVQSNQTNENKKKQKMMPSVVNRSVYALLCHIVSLTAVHSDQSHIAVSDKCVKPSVHL